MLQAGHELPPPGLLADLPAGLFDGASGGACHLGDPLRALWAPRRIPHHAAHQATRSSTPPAGGSVARLAYMSGRDDLMWRGSSQSGVQPPVSESPVYWSFPFGLMWKQWPSGLPGSKEKTMVTLLFSPKALSPSTAATLTSTVPFSPAVNHQVCLPRAP